MFAACDELLLQNYFPDNQRLASTTGGSVATVAPLRDAWWSDLMARVEGSELLIQALERSLHKDLRIREHLGAGCQPAPALDVSDQELRDELGRTQTRSTSAALHLDEERARMRSQLQEESERHIALLASIVKIRDQACEALRASDRILLEARAAERDRLLATVDDLTRENAMLRARNPIGQ